MGFYEFSQMKITHTFSDQSTVKMHKLSIANTMKLTSHTLRGLWRKPQVGNHHNICLQLTVSSILNYWQLTIVQLRSNAEMLLTWCNGKLTLIPHKSMLWFRFTLLIKTEMSQPQNCRLTLFGCKLAVQRSQDRQDQQALMDKGRLTRHTCCFWKIKKLSIF